ncbi:hypothetical protein FRC08_001195 [Ceratobasidium sp. 394]|nr:hypothetical protein FRC08_001195 [Ceratobasidium sp. 394]KAG9075274.1 hypothetical protein FS749_013073 [Ceratobasidium sp. UAMH 11750]
MSTYQVAILTVSDTAAKDSSQDKSGPTIRDVLAGASGFSFEVDPPVIVPDDIGAIQRTVKGWALGGAYDWIITTGGTGFSAR